MERCRVGLQTVALLKLSSLSFPSAGRLTANVHCDVSDIRARMGLAGFAFPDRRPGGPRLVLSAVAGRRSDSRFLSLLQNPRPGSAGDLPARPALERTTGAAQREPVRRDRRQPPGDAEPRPRLPVPPRRATPCHADAA